MIKSHRCFQVAIVAKVIPYIKTLINHSLIPKIDKEVLRTRDKHLRLFWIITANRSHLVEALKKTWCAIFTSSQLCMKNMNNRVQLDLPIYNIPLSLVCKHSNIIWNYANKRKCLGKRHWQISSADIIPTQKDHGLVTSEKNRSFPHLQKSQSRTPMCYTHWRSKSTVLQTWPTTSTKETMLYARYLGEW